ncbi:T-complex protein 1 subunit theta [Salpingoeca rosetta]|uniref:CCT-theta n=1 Tax=Salpingoeca rosetta (strain ATCC 50818 / BSB-021) TaxID=946362 RepID=F2UHS5_SALR5|nr:T-complex protein 1 subunit theta [Salpingoeca rosetta]EGD76674.1 T-complex protein 1 subunit theta [Salpingoeca rosetta]|eukprot:XP_004991046.1 T-complex protein 1 subunit theta [Salpingoeca rosetta]
MALHVPKVGLQTMMKSGAKHYSGMEEAVYRNIGACKEIAQIVRTSFGPNGMNKMILNHLDKLFVTNDAATIIKELEVEHPAARLVVLASQQQEHEAGDATNLVIILAGKMLEKAETLLRMGLSPPEVIEGYEMALEKALEVLPELACHTVEDFRDKAQVKRAIKTVIMSKQNGLEDFLSELVTDACVDIMPKEESRKPFNVDNVRIVKIPGSGVFSSSVVRGMVFTRNIHSSITSAQDARIAAFTADLDHAYTETKGTVLLNTAEELKSYSKDEESVLEKKIKAIKDSGASVIVTTGKVGDLGMHFCNRFELLVVKLNSKFDLKRLCRATGATALPVLTGPSSQELGHCHSVSVQEIGDTTVTVFRQADINSAVSTIIVRGATSNVMDDVERALDDGINAYKSLTKEQRFLPGGGATEIELARLITKFGDTCSGLEQYAIKSYAEALEVVPATLAENCGVKSREVVSNLYAAHENGEKNAGYDILSEDVAVADMNEAGVYDSFHAKVWALKYATRAAKTILRVDQIIMAKKAGGPKPPKQNPNWDED